MSIYANEKTLAWVHDGDANKIRACIANCTVIYIFLFVGAFVFLFINFIITVTTHKSNPHFKLC
jgi:type IV secretory pathway TrbL component